RLNLHAFRGASRLFPSSHLHRRWFGPRRWPNGPDRSAVPSCDIVPRESSSLGRRAATSAFALLCGEQQTWRSRHMASPTLRELTGMNPNPSPISESALVLIDCQQTYREGIMQLVGVEPALKEVASLLKRFRAAGRPVIHIMHDAGPGTPYDVSAPIGQIA